jgi:thymidylate kinase
MDGINTATTQQSWSSESLGQVPPLELLSVLVDALNRAGIRYCHWKSNFRLADTMRGETDVDLLVHRADAPAFFSVIGPLGFKPAVSESGSSTCHYYGLDERSGALAHLHVYFRIVTGGTVLKNYRLPLEDMLLGRGQQVEGMSVPDRAAELISFVIRKMLEYSTPIEALFLAREGHSVAQELEWLRDGVRDEDVSRLLREHLPTLDVELFRQCRDAIRSGSAVHRLALGRLVTSRLAQYRRFRGPRAAVIRSWRVWNKVWHRLVRAGPRESLISGGAIIAVVGADGSGKSTLVEGLSRWLGRDLRVAVVHAGKPPPTILTFVPRVLLPALRKALPRYRLVAVESEGNDGKARSAEELRSQPLFFVYPLRAIMLAYERRRLLVRAHRRAAGGAVVLSDRYPSLQPDVPEGLALSFLAQDASPLYRWFAQVERRIYSTVPAPDLVLYLQVPVDLACHRNLTRNKAGGPKPTGHIRRRYAQTSHLEFPGVSVHGIGTEVEVGETLRSVKRIVWNAL